MSKNIGIWLDRSKAFVVSIDDNKTDVITMTSEIETARHPQCGTEGRCTLIPEKRLKRHKQEVVRKFYKQLIDTIKNAGSVLILGPGTAKNEFIKEIQRIKHLRRRVVGLITADKMNAKQVEQKVLIYFTDVIKNRVSKASQLSIARS